MGREFKQKSRWPPGGREFNRKSTWPPGGREFNRKATWPPGGREFNRKSTCATRGDPPCRAIPGRCQPLEFQRPFGEKLTLMRPEFDSEPFRPGNPSRVLGSPRGSTSEVPGILRSAGRDPRRRDIRTRRTRSATARQSNTADAIRDGATFQHGGRDPRPRRSTCPGHPGPVPAAGVPTSVRRKVNADASRFQF